MRVITRLNIGGPSYQSIFLTERLQDEEFQSLLLCGDVGPREGSMEPLAEERKIPFEHIPGLGREISPKSDLATVFHLYRAMRRYRPAIVHTHLAKAGAVGRLAARLARVPAVLHTYHGHVFHGYFSKRKSQLFIRIERWLASRTDRIVVLGSAQEKEILGFGVGCRAQMRRIPLGLELEPFLTAEQYRGQLKAELGIPQTVPLVGIVARLVPIKAHRLFLDAAQRVAQQRPDTHFAIIGDGDLRDELEARARELGFRVVGHDRPRNPPQPDGALERDRVGVMHFLGFRSDLPCIYADLDVVVLCSLNEGLPVTIIEALAACRPVVATSVGGVGDLVIPEETGTIVPSGDAETLADGIEKLLADPAEAARLARQGRSHVYPRLSVSRLEKDIRALYRELLVEKGLAGPENGRSVKRGIG
jgi:glycosyltransferase involved in cell wall biosynthesis